jgi:hypothetical protein
MTSMLAALNPRADNAEECFNTLQFAVRCQNINLAPHINVIGGPGEGGGLEAGLGGETVEELMEQVRGGITAASMEDRSRCSGCWRKKARSSQRLEDCCSTVLNRLTLCSGGMQPCYQLHLQQQSLSACLTRR